MGIMQLILGFGSVKRIVEKGSFEIGLPIKRHDGLVGDITEHSYEQSVVEKGKIDWRKIHIDHTKDIGEEPEWEKYPSHTITVKDYDKKIDYLDNYYKVAYMFTNPGQVNSTPIGMPNKKDPPIVIIPQQKNPLNKDI